MISRRDTLGMICGVVASASLDMPGEARAATKVGADLLRPATTRFGEAPPLADRFALNIAKRLRHIDKQKMLSVFINRDTPVHGDAAWLGEHAGKFLDAACRSLAYAPDPALRALADEFADTLIAAQGADGYLGGYPADKRWTGWDVWTHQYNLIGLLAFHRLTGDVRALDACRRIGDLLLVIFGDGPGQRDIVLSGEHRGMAATSVLEAMCPLYEATGNPAYLAFCHYIIRSYDHPKGPAILTALFDHGDVSRVADGKAYELLLNLNGLILLHRITGEQRLLDAAMIAWHDIVAHQLYPSGTMSGGEMFQPRGRRLAFPVSRIAETCVTVTWLQMNDHLLRLTGEARFGQEIERTVYNHLFGAQDVKTGGFCYYTPLVGAKEYSTRILCCTSSGPRGIAMLPDLAWYVGTGTLTVNLYAAGHGAAALAGTTVSWRVVGDFPTGDTVSLTIAVEAPASFTLRLRVPEWADSFEVRGAGKVLKGTPGGYLDIARHWTGIETFAIAMTQPTRLVPAGPSYPEMYGVRRGPRLLALAADESGAILRAGVADALDASVRPMVMRREPSGAPATIADPLEPFADCRSGRSWFPRPGNLPDGPAPVTIAAECAISHFSAAVLAGDRVHAPLVEALTNDRDDEVGVDPRWVAVARFLGGPAPVEGEVWFAVETDPVLPLHRIVFRHGSIDAQGGWFGGTRSRPRIEVARAPVPLLNNVIKNFWAAAWEPLAELPAYPSTDLGDKAPFSSGAAFALTLDAPQAVRAIRVIGSAAHVVTCRSLAACS